MKRSLNVLAKGRSSLVIGLTLLGAALDGCGPGGAGTQGPGGPPRPAVSPAATEAPNQKGGRPKVDTTSRRDLHKKRSEERAKGS